MLLKTTRFGEIEINPDDSVEFVDGILGFPRETKFIVLDGPDDCPLKWLQSITSPDLAFVILDPATFKPDYSVPISKSELEKIGLDSVEEAVVAVILFVPENPHDITANLLGPLVFNPEKKTACQLVLSGTNYSTKHRVYPDDVGEGEK